MILPFLVFSDIGLLVLRLVLSAILVIHGWPKIKSLKKNAVSFAEMGFRPGMFWGTAVALLEFGGGVLIALGFLTQIISFLLAVQFLVIILKMKRKQKLAGGYELDLLIAAAAVLLLTIGPGTYALESYFDFWLGF